MGINFSVYEGSGRARCKICDKKIEEGETQVNAYGYQTSGNVHLTCLIEIAIKKGLK